MERSDLWDISNIVEQLKDFPQTYKSMLGEMYNDTTCQVLLRRKLNILVNEGEIFKTAIPGTRFGIALFYTCPKSYYILVEAERIGVNIFCFQKYSKEGRFWLIVHKAWQLKNNMWVECGFKKFFEGHILLFI
jgi:hypothetical protein